MNITITPANVTKVISIATAIYWAITGWVVWHFRVTNGHGLWHELSSGDWWERGGAWIPLLLFISLCGVGVWAMLAPAALRAFKAKLRPFGMKELGKVIWCLSTIPVILLYLGFILLLVYNRVTEA